MSDPDEPDEYGDLFDRPVAAPDIEVEWHDPAVVGVLLGPDGQPLITITEPRVIGFQRS